MATRNRGRKGTEALVLLSGGIDSATCLYLAKKRGDSVRAATFEIHGTAKGELLAAARIAKAAGVVEHRFVELPGLMEASDIKEGPLLTARVPPTYIPMKNAVFYSLAAAIAEETGSQAIIGGHNKDDMSVFEDTSDRFFESLEKTLRAGSPRLRGLRIERPLSAWTKPEVIGSAARLGVPLELTWSCHRAGVKQCGRCEGCLKRAAAFRAAEIDDPSGI